MADFTATQADTATTLQDTLLSPTGSAQDLTGATVHFTIALPGGTVRRLATINTPATAGVVQYQLVPGDVAAAGSFWCKWEVTFADASRQSYPDNRDMVLKVIGDL